MPYIVDPAKTDKFSKNGHLRGKIADKKKRPNLLTKTKTDVSVLSRIQFTFSKLKINFFS